MHANLADTLVIKQDNVFLVTPRDGGLPSDEPHALGLWYRDCRFLCVHELLLNGSSALLLQASDALGTRALHEMTNPELWLADGTLRPQSLSLRCDREVSAPAFLEERLALRSHHDADIRVELELRLGADFEPMLAIRGLVERPRRPPAHVELDGRVLSFSARGRDGVVRTTAVELSEEPAHADLLPGIGSEAPAATAVLRFDLDLPAGGMRELTLGFSASEPGGGTERFLPRRGVPERTEVTTDEELFNRVLARSLQDLELLRSQLARHPYYSAGVPWYATLFGRDSLISAMQTLAFEPAMAAGTLRLLARLLGREHDDSRDEQPGKVLHELRVGEPATLGETPFSRYYGTADATPLWLSLLCDHADWTGSLDLFRELRPQVASALEWVLQHGDVDGDGLIEYRRRTPDGLFNQGWRDSWDGVPDASGAPLEPPVALVEVQGYAIRALRGVARLFELDRDLARAEQLRDRADQIELALERFWLPGLRTYAIGLDGDKRPGSGLTSNTGHLLWAGVLTSERARSVRDTLMGDGMFSGWGIRTLADGHPGYNPIGYHTGSVWPHDNALIACGLREYGLDDDFERLFGTLLEASSQFADYRLPELFGGHDRIPGESPVPYPVACRPQAWAAGSIPHLLATGLGLRADGLARRLHLARPTMPSWLDWAELRGLRVAGASVDLRFERSGDEVDVADARVDGDLELVVEGAGEVQPA
ncbi:MAG: hypothetical protein QOH58_3324 [Thermoleophilaceae bacterium]|jgi:glycogen debranching enzyme|nr:hypothetical protein [Thermoleophilaceae bacterium]